MPIAKKPKAIEGVTVRGPHYNPKFRKWEILWRNDAARDVICAMLNGNEGHYGVYTNQIFVAEAVNIADELVRQLKIKN